MTPEIFMKSKRSLVCGVALTCVNDRRGKSNSFVEIKLRGAVNNQLTPGWDFLGTWHFSDVQMLETEEKSKTEAFELDLIYHTIIGGKRWNKETSLMQIGER